MFKTLLSSFTLSAALAAPAAAQLGQFPTAAQQTSQMYWQQVNAARMAYAYETGYDGLAPSWQNPNSVYYSNGLGLVPAWSANYPGPVPVNGPIIVEPAPYGGGCFPGGGGYGGGFNNTGWGVGINGGIGGNFGGGYGGGGNYDYDNTSWGIGINGGVGGNSGSWGGGGFNNLGWGVGINGGIGGNSGSFRSW